MDLRWLTGSRIILQIWHLLEVDRTLHNKTACISWSIPILSPTGIREARTFGPLWLRKLKTKKTRKRIGNRLIFVGGGHELNLCWVDKSQETRLISVKLCSATSRSSPSHFRRARTTRLKFKVSARHVKLYVLLTKTRVQFRFIWPLQLVNGRRCRKRQHEPVFSFVVIRQATFRINFEYQYHEPARPNKLPPHINATLSADPIR